MLRVKVSARQTSTNTAVGGWRISCRPHVTSMFDLGQIPMCTHSSLPVQVDEMRQKRDMIVAVIEFLIKQGHKACGAIANSENEPFRKVLVLLV